MAQQVTKKEEKESSEISASSGSNKDYSYELSFPDNSSVTIEVKVGTAAFAGARQRVLQRLAPQTNVAGFRPGKAPLNIIEAKLGARVYEDAINDLLPVITAEIIQHAKLEPLDYASYEIKNIALDTGLEYNAKFVILPKIAIPDLKKIKLTTEKETTKDSDVEDMFTKLADDIKASKRKAMVDKESEVEIDWEKDLEVEGVKTEVEVKARLKDNLDKKKAQDFEEKQIEELIRQSLLTFNITPPKKLVDTEVHRLEHQYVDRIEKLGLKLEDFLKMQKTDLSKLHETWEKEAEFAIASDVMFMLINKEYALQVSAEELQAEIAKISDPKLQDYYSETNGRRVMSSIMARQKALAKLKELAGVPEAKTDEAKSS